MTDLDSGAAEVAAPGKGLRPAAAPYPLLSLPQGQPQYSQHAPRRPPAQGAPSMYMQASAGLHLAYHSNSLSQQSRPVNPQAGPRLWQQQPAGVPMQRSSPSPSWHTNLASHMQATSAAHGQSHIALHQQPCSVPHWQRHVEAGPQPGLVHSSQQISRPHSRAVYAASPARVQGVYQQISQPLQYSQAHVHNSNVPQH